MMIEILRTARRRFKFYITVLVLCSQFMGQAYGQNARNDINSEIEAILNSIESDAAHFSNSSKEGLDLLRLTQGAQVKDIQPKTIDHLARLVTNDNAAIRFHMAMALGDIGPAALRALTALKAALKIDDELLKRDHGIISGGPGPLAYDAEIEAIRKIQVSR